jgi:DNA mismatch repair protein MutL
VTDSETPTIRALDDATVRRIAAGEVVERPASVVKELVENSLDAGASRVTVAVEGDGTDAIRVRDDGVGMDATALERAVEEHTTSKIDDADDLQSVGTLGFRGEALHTIAAVSRLTVRSRPAGGRGHELVVEGGEAGDVEPSGCPPGTVVEVADLFYNTPARERFLKTPATEFDHVNRVVTQYALANPDVAMALEHDGREVFATEGDGDLQSAVLAVYGRDVAESMLRVDAASVSGLVSHPETTRAGREYLSTFVNGRYVTSGPLREAVLEGYGDQLAPDRYPFAVLFVEVPPDAVDVNVHPRKMAVRFDDGDAVAAAVSDAVRATLVDHGLVRSGAPRGRSAPEQTEIDPTSPEASAVGGVGAGDDGNGDDEAVAADVTDATDADSSATDRTPDRPTTADAPAESTSPENPSATPDADGSEPTDDGPPSDGRSSARDAPAVPGDDGRAAAVRGATEQRTLDGREATERRSFDRLPSMRLLGQFDDTYVVAETPEGLALVDQHAADERVNYERLRDAVAGETPTQALAEPVELELTAREADLFEGFEDALAQLGFHADRVDDRRVEVRTVPAVVDAALDPSLLRDALGGFADGRAEETVDAVADAILADLACHPSITGNTSLTEGSVLDLLSALDDCENPFACPHGRPVVVAFDHDEIADRFERDYPGHAGRRAE